MCVQPVSEESPLPADERQLAASEKVTDVRLPRHLVAEKYKLKLIPFIIPGNFTIKGFVEVLLEADEDMLLWIKYCNERYYSVVLHTGIILEEVQAFLLYLF